MKKNALVFTVCAIVAAVIVVVAALLLLSGGNDRYTELIPSSADLVFRINLDEASEGIGLKSDDGKKIIKEWMDKAGNENSRKIKGLLENPEDIGLRVDHDIYMFVELEPRQIGLVCEMYDADKFKETLKKLDKDGNLSFNERDGITWATTDDDDEVIVYNSDFAMIYESEASEDNAKEIIKLSEDKQYKQTSRFKHLKDAKGQCAIDFTMKMMPKHQSAALDEIYTKSFGKDFSIRDLFITSSLSFGSGNIEMFAQYYTANDKVNVAINKALDAYGNINGAFMEHNKNMMFWMCFNIDQEKFVEAFEENLKSADLPDEAKGFVNAVIGVFKSMCGDMAMEIDNQKSVNDQLPVTISVNAEVNNDNAAADLYKAGKKEIPGFDEVVKKNGSDYTVSVPTVDSPVASFGVKDNVFYFNTSKDIKKASNNVLEGWKDEINGSQFFMYANGNEIAKFVKENNETLSSDAQVFYEFCKNTQDCAVYMKDKKTFAFTLKYSKADTFIKFIDNMVQALD